MQKIIKLLVLCVTMLIMGIIAGCGSSSHPMEGHWYTVTKDPALDRPCIEHLIISKNGDKFLINNLFETYTAVSEQDRNTLVWQEDAIKLTFQSTSAGKTVISATNQIGQKFQLVYNEKKDCIIHHQTEFYKDKSKVKGMDTIKDTAKKYMIAYYASWGSKVKFKE